MEYYVVGGGGGGGGGGFPASMDASEPSSALAMLQEWQLHPSADIAHQETMWRSRFPPSQEGTNIPPPTPYPERPGEQDCPYYMRTGLCRFGMSCRFNHPLNRRQASGTARIREDLPERIGQPECQYYLKTGTCKFGATCKYHHPQDKAGSMGRTQLNLLNLPLRLGERECSYYLRTGQCKFGPTCKFNHPQPTFLPLPTYLGAGSSSSPAPQPYPAWQMPRPYLLSPRLQAPPDYTPLILPPPQGVVSMHGWNPYQVQGSSIGMVPPQEGQQSNYIMGPSSPHDAMPMVAPYPTYVSGSGAVFPDRLGQPECQYFMKTGDCKYGMSCKFHHPRDRPVPSPSCVLSPMGLPLRPGAQSCAFYSKHGYCKFGSQCKFNHPFVTLPYSPLASPM